MASVSEPRAIDGEATQGALPQWERRLWLQSAGKTQLPPKFRTAPMEATPRMTGILPSQLGSSALPLQESPASQGAAR